METHSTVLLKRILTSAANLITFAALVFTVSATREGKVIAQGSATALWTIPNEICATDLYSCALRLQIDSLNRLFVYKTATYQLYVIGLSASTFQQYDLSAYSDFLQPGIHFNFIPFNDYIVLSNVFGGMYKYTLSTKQFESLPTNAGDSISVCDYNGTSEYYPAFGRLGTDGSLLVCGVV